MCGGGGGGGGGGGCFGGVWGGGTYPRILPPLFTTSGGTAGGHGVCGCGGFPGGVRQSARGVRGGAPPGQWRKRAGPGLGM
jgi:hypothetical protein